MSLSIASKLKVVSYTPVTDTAIYAAGDQVGVITELTNFMDNPSGQTNIVSMSLLDKDKQASILQVLLFNDKPVVTSVNNGALDISDAEMLKCIGVISVVAADYFALNVNSMANIKNINMVMNAVKSGDNQTGKSVWAIIRSGGTPTYTTTSSLVLTFGLSQG